MGTVAVQGGRNGNPHEAKHRARRAIILADTVRMLAAKMDLAATDADLAKFVRNMTPAHRLQASEAAGLERPGSPETWAMVLEILERPTCSCDPFAMFDGKGRDPKCPVHPARPFKVLDGGAK